MVTDTTSLNEAQRGSEEISTSFDSLRTSFTTCDKLIPGGLAAGRCMTDDGVSDVV